MQAILIHLMNLSDGQNKKKRGERDKEVDGRRKGREKEGERERQRVIF